MYETQYPARFETADKLSDEDREAIIELVRQALMPFMPFMPKSTQDNSKRTVPGCVFTSK